MAANRTGLAAGTGLRIAVIDSGVNAAHPHIRKIAGGLTITADSQEDDYTDVLGHGTAVMAAIQEKAPAADYFAVRIFQSCLQTDIDVVLRAMEWCVQQRMDIVNLSLGSTNPMHAERFAPWMNSAILVSARLAGSETAYPGSLAGAIAVEADAGLPRDRYSFRTRGGQTTFLASPHPRPIPGVPKERNLSGISFAVANMSGFVARACTEDGKLSREALRARLISEAAKSASPHLEGH